MTADFEAERAAIIKAIGDRPDIKENVLSLIVQLSELNYGYCFDWMGLPIIQSPFDIVEIQNIIHKTRPDVIIETGIARGGSLALSASMLKLLDIDGKVIGVDIDIRKHTRDAMAEHPLKDYIHMVEGSSIADETLDQVRELVGDAQKVMVMLDSDHTYEHVLKELELYSPFVKKGQWIIVMDTVVEDLPDENLTHRDWVGDNNPKRSVRDFIAKNDRFKVRHDLNDKLLFTAAMDGYLECLKD